MAIRALLIGENTFPFHALDEKGPELIDAIGDAATVTTTTDRDELRELGDYDVLIDYLTDSTLTDPQLTGLLSFVRNGGGYVGVHCAVNLTTIPAEDPDELLDSREAPVPELRSLLGGHSVNESEQAEFGVEIVADHPVTAGVEDFRVYDEPYHTVVEDVPVLARMDHPDLEAYPVVWARSEDDGRVCCLSIGHAEESLRHEGTRRLLRNAIAWVADEKS